MTWNPLKRPHLSTKLSLAPSCTDRADDQHLEITYYKLQHVEETVRRVQKNMKKYIEYLTNASKAEQKITSDLSSSQLCYQNDELRKMVEDYHSVTAKGVEGVSEFAAACGQCVLEPLKKYTALFAAIEAALQQREQLAAEWRAAAGRARRLEERERTGANVAKLEKERRAAAAAAAELADCHAQLLADLRYFLDKRPDFFHPVLEALMRAQLELLGSATRLFTLLVRVPAAHGSPSSAALPEAEFRARVDDKLARVRALAIVRQ